MHTGIALASYTTHKGDAAVKLVLGDLKHLYRCIEKMCFKVGENRYHAESVCDIVRCIIECDTCVLVREVLRALIDCPDIHVVRVKDRVNHLTSMNWMDIMVNITIEGEASAHVCEIQVVHRKMLLARSGLGGHVTYSRLRAAAEILEVRGVDLVVAERPPSKIARVAVVASEPPNPPGRPDAKIESLGNRRKRAAKLMQACVRGHIASASFAQGKRVCIALQAMHRRRAAVVCFSKQMHAVIVLQAWWKFVQHKQVAIRLQAFVRCHLAAANYAQSKHVCITLQAMYRRRVALAYVSRNRVMLEHFTRQTGWGYG